MAISHPGTSGNYLSLLTALTTAGASVFGRFRLSELPASGAMPFSIESSSTSVKTGGGALGDGNHVHGLVLEPGTGVYDINEIAYWDGFLGPIASGVALNTWVNWAAIFYTANSRPAVKFALRPAGGALVTRVRNDAFWGGVYDTFTNPRVSIGAGNGGGSPFKGLSADVFMYPVALTSDGDITDQFDSLDAAHASPYWDTSLRGYATVALAIQKEAGSAPPTAWTHNGGGLSVDNAYDDTGGAGTPVLTGGGTLSPADSQSAPATPTGLAVQSATSTSVELEWNSVAGATEYLIYGRKTATEADWDLYQSITGEATERIVINDLEPRVAYGFRIAAVNAAGESAMSAEVTQTTQNLRVRCRTRPAAAGTTGVSGAVWRTPDVGGVVGERLFEFSGLEFEPTAIVDPADGKTVAVLYIEILQTSDAMQALPLQAGDNVYVVAQTSTKSTRIMDDAVVQEA